MRKIALLIYVLLIPVSVQSAPAHGIAMHGNLKYGPDFENFAYVFPAAPKGGTLNLAVLGSFDSLNPLIVRGTSAEGIRDYVYESLMVRAHDEPFSLYGLLAEKIETPPERNWVAFTLRGEAQFSDGNPVTVQDIIFSHKTLRDKGRPNHRFYYSKVTKVEQLGHNTVRFWFKEDGDREMPLIMGLMPILPKHVFENKNFDQTSLDPPTGSGPYLVSNLDPGKTITYQRNPNYWGWNIPANRGLFNFDKIHMAYFRDANTMFEAFKKGLIDLRIERDPGNWAQGYKFPAVKDGRIRQEEFELSSPAGMTGLVFNTRRKLFSDIRVRQAMTQLFDFQWINKTFYHGLYARTASYFERSELSSANKAADELEKSLLKKSNANVRPSILDGTFAFPKTDGSGRNRTNRRIAMKLLAAAGYALKNGKLVNQSTGENFSFEILTANRGEERLLLNYARSLSTVGIDVRLRQVDSAQYQQRKKTYDFDMIQNSWGSSLSPGNEQNFRWSSKAAETEGTYNYPGIKNPAVDKLIEALLAANTRSEFVSSVRALDRVLLSGFYVMPLFHVPRQWVAYWNSLKHPKLQSVSGIQVDSWWSSSTE